MVVRSGDDALSRIKKPCGNTTCATTWVLFGEGIYVRIPK